MSFSDAFFLLGAVVILAAVTAAFLKKTGTLSGAGAH
jgi:hypothetical protein